MNFTIPQVYVAIFWYQDDKEQTESNEFVNERLSSSSSGEDIDEENKAENEEASSTDGEDCEELWNDVLPNDLNKDLNEDPTK